MAFTKIVSPGIDTTGSYTVQELNTVGIVTAGTVQVGAATTVHTTGIDLGSGNITSHNINSTGIITATSFVGPVTGNITGDITATSGTFSGNVSIGGTLTYEDVTNIDSVGIITAQAGIRVTGGSVGIGTDTPGDNLEIKTDAHGEGLTVKSTGSTSNAVTFDANRSGGGQSISNVYGRWNGTTVAQMGFVTGVDATNKNDGYIYFGTESDASNGNVNATERLRIEADGGTIISNAGTFPTSTNETLSIQGEGHNGHGTSNTRSVFNITGAISSNSNAAGLWIGARTNENTAVIGTRTASGNLAFETYSGGWGERLRIHADGEVECKGGAAGQNALLVTGNYSSGNNVDIQTWQRSGGAVQAKIGYKDADTSMFFGTDTAHSLAIITTGTERLRIDSSGKLLINSSTVTASYGGKLQVTNTNIAVNSFAANPHSQTFLFAKSRGTSGSGGTIVQNGDNCGHIEWYADDGQNTENQIAKISAAIDGQPGVNDTPGRLIFYTTADGANTSTERLRITSAGRIIIGGYDDFVRGNLQVVDGGGGELNLGRFDTTVSQYNDIGHIFFTGNAGSSGHAIGGISCYAAQNQTATSKPSYLTFTTCDASNPPTLVERLRITENGTLVHYGGHKNNSGGSNLGSGTYYRINASVTVPQNSTKTLTFTGLQTGWMTIRIGGYGNAGSQAISCMYELGGYMTATYTYDIHTVRQWARTGSIGTNKNASNFTVTLPGGNNASGCVTFITVEGNNANIAVNSN